MCYAFIYAKKNIYICFTLFTLRDSKLWYCIPNNSMGRMRVRRKRSIKFVSAIWSYSFWNSINSNNYGY